MSDIIVAEIAHIKDSLAGLMLNTGIDYEFSDHKVGVGWRLKIIGAAGWLDCSLSDDETIIYLDRWTDDEIGMIGESDHAYYKGNNAKIGMGSLGEFYCQSQNLTVVAARWVLGRVSAQEDSLSM